MSNAVSEAPTHNPPLFDTLAQALIVSSVRKLDVLIKEHGYDKDMAMRIIASQVLRIEAWVIVSEVLFIAQQHAEQLSLYAKDIYPPAMVIAILATCISIIDLVNTMINDHDEQAKLMISARGNNQ